MLAEPLEQGVPEGNTDVYDTVHREKGKLMISPRFRIWYAHRHSHIRRCFMHRRALSQYIIIIGAFLLSATGCGPSEEERTRLSWNEFERRSTRIFEGAISYVVEGDLPVTHEELRDYYKRNIAAEVPLDSSSTLQQPLIVNRVNSQDDIWYGALRRNLRYCVSNDFGAVKSRVVSEMN